jgi:hypothetical protein
MEILRGLGHEGSGQAEGRMKSLGAMYELETGHLRFLGGALAPGMIGRERNRLTTNQDAATEGPTADRGRTGP